LYWITTRASWTGTHRAGLLPILPIPVTNRAFEFEGMMFWGIRDGRIMERYDLRKRIGCSQEFIEPSAQWSN
jgi:hypothetical protein